MKISKQAVQEAIAERAQGKSLRDIAEENNFNYRTLQSAIRRNTLKNNTLESSEEYARKTMSDIKKEVFKGPQSTSIKSTSVFRTWLDKVLSFFA